MKRDYFLLGQDIQRSVEGALMSFNKRFGMAPAAVVVHPSMVDAVRPIVAGVPVRDDVNVNRWYVALELETAAAQMALL